MYKENLSLEEIIDNETKKIEEKYELSENLIEYFPPKKVSNKTGIDYEAAKLLDLKRKKEKEIVELEREIYELNYEIGYKMGIEIGRLERIYKFDKVIQSEK